ncbi:MAG: phenylalanine--tRNA ligase subunit alpha [Euryarchaeota archaeon]|nr:phenylalanine--tRNA ligase subunit alpha [Euryarchaeota archaeon]
MASEEDILSTLSPRDKRVLKAISKGLSDPQEIAGDQQIKPVSVISSAEALAEKDLIRVEKGVDKVYTLTEEGAQYAEKGLPERRILDMAADGLPLSQIKDPGLKIGIGWLRKKGWAAIDKGMIRPRGEASLGEDEKTLELLSRGPKSGSELDARVLTDLKKRNLVTSTISKSWKYQITPRTETLSFTTDADLVGEVGQITTEMIKTGKWKEPYLLYNGEKFHIKRYDVTLSAERTYPGKVHPYQRLIRKMREIMLEMGFTEIRGEIVQSSFWNFDALFQPQDHPAREMQDTFYLDTRAEIPDYAKVKDMHESGGDVGSAGWGGSWDPEVARREVLRTHTTAITIKYLADHPSPPVKAFSIDRAYRREAIDPTHTPEFEQLEGVIMDEGVTFRNLLGVLEQFYAKMGFEEVRFRPAYFPYTEPSVEPEVYIEGLGWVELGGAGVFRREVTASFGIDHPVLAWGLGVSRVAMLTLGLKDLRELYQSDIGWLRETPVSARTI